jgi:Cu(I)/Ag(I) efflux system membrane fusion protein/cobalt-zinc-cadmium efflux system membrane fusion protein
MRTYRTGFVVAIIGNIALVGVVVVLWWHSHTPKTDANKAAIQETNATMASAKASATTPVSSETPLVPVQLSPQKLQSIGVKTGEVRRETVVDEISSTGNVAVDETRLSYVQTRFSGYIEKVFADATYQYVRKGQPLFTIYSPDLVATEREYLVAKQNQHQVSQSTVPGVTSGAASLLDAAAGG